MNDIYKYMNIYLMYLRTSNLEERQYNYHHMVCIIYLYLSNNGLVSKISTTTVIFINYILQHF